MLRSIRELWLAYSFSRDAWDSEHSGLGRDRRVFERVRLELPCRIENPLFNETSTALTVNVSLGGVGLIASVMWPEGSRVRVHLDVLSIDTDGLIIFRKEESAESGAGMRYGVKFYRISFWNLFKLRQILKQGWKGPLAVL